MRSHRYGLARVRGESMRPTLCEGQLVLLRYAATPQPGDVVVVRLPATSEGQPRALAIKRLTHYEADGTVWIESDNQRAPGRVDSWTIGSLTSSSVLAVMVIPIPHPPRLARGRSPRSPFRRGGKPRSG